MRRECGGVVIFTFYKHVLSLYVASERPETTHFPGMRPEHLAYGAHIGRTGKLPKAGATGLSNPGIARFPGRIQGVRALSGYPARARSGHGSS